MSTGKYDLEAEAIIRQHKAAIAIVVVVAGDQGDGFSIASCLPEGASLTPGILRSIADTIEKGSGAMLRGTELSKGHITAARQQVEREIRELPHVPLTPELVKRGFKL